MEKKLIASFLRKIKGHNLILKMKLTFLILTGCLLHVSATVYSQATKFSFNVESKQVADVLKDIEAKSDFRFFYQREQVDVTRKVDLNVSDKNVEDILNELFKGQEVRYNVLPNNLIVIAPKSENLTSISSQQQDKKVTGKVTDSSGTTLPGVSVVVKGTTTGVITNAEGNFAISNIPKNAVLQFSFMGMKTQEIAVGDKTAINIRLDVETIGIEEVVAVGYGTQKKVNLTGSVGVVKGESLLNSPATNVISSLQGRLPGVAITQIGGEPGKESVSILIRGLGSMNDASPMIIVDGLDSQLDNISPNDIESVSVLKDAAAAAIYGSRAANGVILVTTKRGKSGLSEITYNSSYGWQKATDLPKHLSSAQYAELYNEGLSNEGLAPRYSADDISKYRSGVDPYNFPNTDWLGSLITESGFTQTQNFTFSGGNEQTSFRASFEYFDQNGLIKKSGRKRYNARINVDSKIKEWFTLGINSALTRDNLSSPSSPYNYGTEFFRQANVFPPTIPNKNADGTWHSYSGANPLAWLADGGLKTSINSHFMGSTVGEIKLTKELTLKGIAGADFYLADRKDHEQVVTYGDGSFQGPASVNDEIGRYLTTTLQSLLNYEHKFNKHGVKVLLGASREASINSDNSAFRQDFPSNYLDQLDGGSTSGWRNAGNTSETRIGSLFGRINYEYNSKYLIEANLRRDASSKFAPGNRIGWFPSMSAGWRMSQESFMKNINFISNLKLRASWGQLGNDRIGDYMYIQRITLGQNYNFGGSPADGAATTVAATSNITWEKTSELNLGIDINLFGNKLLSVSADYYNRYTDNILATVPVSIVFGLNSPLVNAGAMSNKGLELLLEHSNKIGEVKYSVAINAAYNKNNVEKYENPSKGDRIYAEGISWGSFYGYQAVGIYKTNAEAAASAHITGVEVKAGDLIYNDLSKDGKIDGDDRIALGNAIPEITFGSNINLKYKGFDIVAFFQGATNVYRSLGVESFWPFDPSNAQDIHLDRTIVKDGKVLTLGHYPRTVVNEKGNRVQSSFTVLDATYLRLKNIQLGYNLPESLLKVVKISKARVYISGQNLLTFSHFPSGYDPELDGSQWNLGPNRYPQVKFYTFGFDLTF